MHTEQFDFDTLKDRGLVASEKWARRTEAEKAAGVVPMSVADMEFVCAPAIVRKMSEMAEYGLYGYTGGDDRYNEAVAGWMQKRHGWQIEKEWIVPENGVVPAMSVAIRAFTEPGDGILLQSPGYGPFTWTITGNGRVPVYNALVLGEDGYYHMDLDDLRAKAANPTVKMMFLCSPHNPVGRIWTKEELRAVADICREHNVLVFSDEIHFDLEIDGKHTVFCEAAPEMRDQCIISTATSKTFNLAGLQLCNIIIPNEKLRDAFHTRMNGDGYESVSFFGYHATIAAYTEGEAWLDALLEYVRENIRVFTAWFEENLPKVRVLPVQGTYLAWVDFRALGMDDAALEKFVRDEAMVIPNMGSMFGAGGEGFMRFNMATPRKEIERALQRLLAAAQKRGLA